MLTSDGSDKRFVILSKVVEVVYFFLILRQRKKGYLVLLN